MNKQLEEPKSRNDPKENNQLDYMISQALTKISDWYEKDKVAKQSYNEEMDEMYKLYKSKHWDLIDESGNPLRTEEQKRNHPNAVENVAFSLIEGLIAEFSEPKELVDYPTEEGDDEAAGILTELKTFIAYKNRIVVESIKWLRSFFLYGTGIWRTVWDNDWKGGTGPNRWRGDIRWGAVHPRMILPDARCKDTVEDGRRCHHVGYWTIEDLEEIFPEAEGLTADTLSADFLAPDEAEDSTLDALDDQVLVVETWYKGRPLILKDDEADEGPGLHRVLWAGEGTRKYLEHENYVYFEPGEDTKFPFDFAKCYEREDSPWGTGEMYYLKNPQLMLNKTAEMIMEGHLHYAMGQTYYDESAVTEKQKKQIEQYGMLAGMWFAVTDPNGIKREYGKGVPATLENETQRVNRLMETIIGRFDISQGKTPGSVTAFRALDLLAARAQVRLRTKELTINTAYENCGNYINRLIAQNYNERRRYRIRGEGDTLKFGVYESDQFKKAYLFESDESISLQELEGMLAAQQGLPPEQQLIEGEDFEVYCPQFDTMCKITSSLPTDRVFYMEMAKELYTGGLIDDEIFWHVVKYGKFPPIEKIMDKIEQKKAEVEAQKQQEQAMAQQMADAQVQTQAQPIPEQIQGGRGEPVIVPDQAQQPSPDEIKQNLINIIQGQ